MLLSILWTGFVALSIFCALVTGHGGDLTGAAMEGGKAAVNLVLSMTGAVCLWTGVGRLMEKIGITAMLSNCLAPLLHRVFPETQKDSQLAGDLSANICANLLGLGNAATPMGISAARAMAKGRKEASAGLCRLVVLNTASIQLLPTNVAALRSALGAAAPFDILPAVWITSFLSASLGLCCAVALERIWKC